MSRPCGLRFGLLLAAALPLLACAQAPAAGSDGDVARAEAAIADLGQRLRSVLMERMQAQGPVDAVDVCHQQAPAIAASVAAAHGLRIGRSSDHLRSPQNAPDDWQQAVLAEFAERAAAGETPQSMKRAEGGERFRYASGIAAEGPCLVCHGTEVSVPVREAIGARYPRDRATGYAAGDLRGLFWVEIDRVPAVDPEAAPNS